MISNYGFAQDVSVYDNYKIPTFESKTLYVQGQDFLNYKSQGSNNRMLMNLGGNLDWRNQSPMMTYYVKDNLSYTSDSKGSPSGDATSTMANHLWFGGKKWMMDDAKGVFAFVDGDLQYSKTTDFDATKSLPLTLGAGYGRVTEAKPVAQAIVILKELGADASNDNVLKLADVIAKWNAGYYIAMYKDDAAIEYYKAIAGVTGKGEDAIKVGRILVGAPYQIADRWVGWWGQIGYSNDVMADPSTSGNIKLGGQYAMPMDLDKQFYAWAWYNMDLNDNPINNFNLGASYSIDHSYLWSSIAKFDFTSYMPDKGDGVSDWSLSIESDYWVINQLSAYGKLSMMKDEFHHIGAANAKDATTEFKLGARYYIW